MFSINDMQAANPRFLVPLRRFTIDVSFPQLFLQQSQVIALRGTLSEALTNSTNKFNDILPRDVWVGIPPQQVDSPADMTESDPVYSFGGVSTPVYGFSLALGRRMMRLSKENTSVGDLLDSLNVMRAVVEELFPNDHHPGSLADGLGLRNSVYHCEFAFNFELKLLENLRNRAKPVVNTEIVERLVRTSVSHGSATSTSPIGALQLEDISRADVLYMGPRTLGGKELRQVSLKVEFPHNVSQRDVDMMILVRSGTKGVPFDFAHLHNFETPVLDFYRDLVLNRFFEDMFGEYGIEARL